MDWMSLKSGSDVRGKACGEGAVITPDVVRAIGMAFAMKLAEAKKKDAREMTIALGRDSRITGPDLLTAVADGIVRTGANVLDYGMCSTPAMYMAIITPGFKPDGTIMITASHHPWDRNGLKFFTEKGGIESRDVEDLLKISQNLKPEDYPAAGTIKKGAFLPVYMELLSERIRQGLETTEAKPLRGLQVAVDAGNGAGGFYATLLKNLGANTEGSQFLEPDGMFPNHIPNPENPEAISSLREAVLQSGADLGVIFDTDCDRAAIVDSDGREINRNRLIALISTILLEKEQGLTIVTDSVTSSGLKTFIQERGGKHYRYKRGYRNVINEAIQLNEKGICCPLAIETSGHAALKENHFLDDGMYLVTVLIVKAMQLKKKGMTLGTLIKDLKEPVESAEIRLDITAPDFRRVGQEAIDKVSEFAEKSEKWEIAPDNREGIRIQSELQGIKNAGWLLLRMSVHDPVLPINCESDVKDGVQEMLQDLESVLEDMNGLNLRPLKEILYKNKG